ncbi:hypothetical protein MWN34_08240 [Ancylobacter sp. 6x-1]|uniref:Uncharacterized protein n=1 Tax=Ancylobacter crimeensis TaxID=2579147 RepID=A0ABT0DAB6_9HYPH|nr:hypothetical protein [Ancylobacter crimeensis]MCK0196901.1 hypothetical protein [Ancylobacter crimeensis]
MKIFDALKNILKDPQRSPADLATAVEDARAVVAEAGAEVERLQGERRAMLTASEPDRARHKQALAAASDRLADARLYVEALEERRAEAQKQAQEVMRVERYEHALAARDAAAKRLAKEYPHLVGIFVDLMEAVAGADLIVDAANADLPTSKPPIARTEAHARFPRRQREVLSDRVEFLWVAEGMSQPLDNQSLVQPTGADVGVARVSDPRHNPLWAVRSHVPVHRCAFRRIEYRPADPVVAPPNVLSGSVRLPAMREGSLSWGYSQGRIVDPPEVLEEVHAVRSAKAAWKAEAVDPAPVTVEFERIDDPVEQTAA